MSETYLYLSMMPEALVASMLAPKEFGTYLAVGTEKRTRGEAMYFSLKSGFRNDYFDLSSVPARCVPHADGQPKRSLYLGIYRVLEHVPLEAICNLYLVTKDGRVLELAQGSLPAWDSGKYHLYDEICPVHPLIASSLNPQEFCRFITDPKSRLHVPRICFVEINLGDLVENPPKASVDERSLPYLAHIRDCMQELQTRTKYTKTVDRTHQIGGWCRRIKNGYVVGDQTGLIYFPFPSPDELDRKHHDWWRSASV